MFVTHCPDPQLSLALSSKPLEEWTTNDMQVRLDEHHQKKRLQQKHCAMHSVDSSPAVQAGEAKYSHVQTAVHRPAPAPKPAEADMPSTPEGRSMLSLFWSACLTGSLLHAPGSLGLGVTEGLGAHVLSVAGMIMTLCPTAGTKAFASAAMLLEPQLEALVNRETSWPTQGGD
ncbi:hypothetical protein DPEC_G00237220 [Dallia pectoralis]|uniref:Uncharacterized protein n=1 Tax=Dallia pectoralis TaxID=75939 RepID=A0ACC2FYX5_DALPE|nr:hypothetical protein DPEC_G00237220 [Dallia pectoralis]